MTKTLDCMVFILGKFVFSQVATGTNESATIKETFNKFEYGKFIVKLKTVLLRTDNSLEFDDVDQC